jgi:rare lipoprotein A
MKKIKPFKEKGYASWYGKKYHGNKTSVGEIYDMYQMTAAHKTLPLPSFVKITNLKNNKTVIVRVNDRGPFIKDRIIDLSYAAAYRLDIIEKGSEQVEIEVIIPNVNLQKNTIEKGFFLQIGAFAQKNNALDLVKKIEAINSENNIKIIKKASLYSVVIGPSSSKEEAEKLSSIISSELKQNAFIIKH